MRSDERQKYILSTAQLNGFVSISEAASALDVSIETIRRDINKLCGANKLKKTRGGASPTKLHFRKDGEYSVRICHNQKEKVCIGIEAASMIESGSIVALDCGVSIQYIASCVSGVSNVTFVTNSIPTAVILLKKLENKEISGRLIFIGGEIDAKNRFSKGTQSTDAVDSHYFDIAFISCTALSSECVASYSIDEAFFSKHLINRSAQTVLIAESEKIGKNSFSSFAKPTDFDYIIVDDKNPIPTELEAVLSGSNTELIIVNSNSKQQA